LNIGTIQTSLGRLGLVEVDGAITKLLWAAEDAGQSTPVLKEGLAQLGAYFAGDLTKFALPLNAGVGDFGQSVLDQMIAIPYGYTKTYGEIAKAINSAAQPVGTACGANPIPIIIPCHRVLAQCGLGGFSGAGGIETKVKLLRLEGAGLLI
jgi:methylated-DNA-[protein]-cysteine S-methyltransferase